MMTWVNIGGVARKWLKNDPACLLSGFLRRRTFQKPLLRAPSKKPLCEPFPFLQPSRSPSIRGDQTEPIQFRRGFYRLHLRPVILRPVIRIFRVFAVWIFRFFRAFPRILAADLLRPLFSAAEERQSAFSAFSPGALRIAKCGKSDHALS